MVVAGALISVVLLLGLAAAGVACGRRPGASPVLYALTALVSAATGLLALGFLLGGGGPAETVTLPLGLPWVGSLMRVDALSAFFLFIIHLGGTASSLYAIGAGRHEHHPGRVLPFFPAFLAGMSVVVLADDAFSFLVGWEFMSLTSWALVMAHHRAPENARAGYLYIVMAGIGTLALVLAFSLLAGSTGDYTFALIRKAHLTPLTSAAVLALVLIGAGSKAGLYPLHAWLPHAHPAAPSHVSALMSGVMTKVALYGVIRIVFDLLGPPQWGWGVAVMTVGAVTAPMGILYALLHGDLKRVLAYSTIENVGFIVVNLGLALAFKANFLMDGAALAFTAALLHILNHALFKSTLFLGAGAILTATGERGMDKLGGLIHRMPITAVAFLVACMAISALPPLNGFVSEWLSLQTILLSPELPQWTLKLLVPAAGCLLALATALAAAGFVRIFGIVFLSRPRSPAAASATEADPWARGVMLGLAGLCLLIGILPGLVIAGLAPAVSGIIGAAMPDQLGTRWLTTTPIDASHGTYNGLLVFLFMGITATAASYAIHRLASRTVRRSAAWDCGFPVPSPATQYTAASFSQPLRRVFGTVLFRVRETVDMPAPGDLRPGRFAVTIRDIAWDAVYHPVTVAVRVLADRINTFQFQTIRRYLTLVFLTLILMLGVLAIWS